jgi:EAL domain-containing protein (putative c-di-GMP-specific phosphodiesterase class I)
MREVESLVDKGPPDAGRVLVVDDDPLVLALASRTLATAGFQIETAANGRLALEILDHGSFDAIVSDISMPVLGGIELLSAVRARDLDVPVLLMTAYPALDTAIGAVEYGAMGYLQKPFDPGTLESKVSRAVRLHRLARLKREAVALVSDERMQFADRSALEASFANALATLWMAFQPIVSWPRQRTVAFEALMRTNEPKLPHPIAVINAAERLGRFEDLGRAVRARIASHMSDVPAEAVYVNLHPRDLLDDQLYSKEAPLSRHASRIVLELTERASLDDIGSCDDRVARLRRMGYRLAIDDLGAGYAGLSSFTQIEPDVVKFDMSLVRDIEASPLKRRLVRSMTALFTEMDIDVVAEGVETEAERNTLISVGCELLQGYLFARPAVGFPDARLS